MVGTGLLDACLALTVFRHRDLIDG